MRSVKVMSRLIPALMLFLVPASAYAATFEERIDKANAVYETADGEAYEKKLGPYIHEAIKKCAPAGSTSRANPGKFVLVADVSPEGILFNPMVKPETIASTCFRTEFISQALPAPPNSIVSDGFAPLVVEIFIVP